MGEYNKKDIDNLKNLYIVLNEMYQTYIESLGCKYNPHILNNFKEGINLYAMSLPTFIEKFTVEDIFKKEGFRITYGDDLKDKELTKNLSLINSILDRCSTYLKEAYHVEDIRVHLYYDGTLNIEICFNKNEELENIKHFFDFLFKLLNREKVDTHYFIENDFKVVLKF